MVTEKNTLRYKVRGGYIQIDAIDLPLVKQGKWHVSDGYVKGRKGVALHRVIANAPAGTVVDHINGDPLDNRRQNLRVCTHQQNLWNGRAHRDGRSKYRGVSWHKGIEQWRVQIQGKFVGHFRSETDAALAYNTAALERFGEFAKLNLIEDSRQFSRQGGNPQPQKPL